MADGKLIRKLSISNRYEVGDLSHIYLKGTDLCIGFLGDGAVEIITDNLEHLSLEGNLEDMLILSDQINKACP